MTKRALSLLLTLVMVLSLCVPALAAEDFEAEAPAEVVEEAPEAPEAPVAPEAEEPADEPVVDEPAAEEPVEEAVAEDAPEMASVLPEDAEDLPYLVALGKVSKINHWKLEKTLKTAASYKERVDAGELYVKTSYIEVGQDDSPAKEFLDAYATAQKNLDGINGEVVDIDVTDASVLAIIAELKTYFSKDDGGDGKLTSSLDEGGTGVSGTTDAMTADNLYLGLKAGDSYSTSGIPNSAKYQPLGTEAYRAFSVSGSTKFTGSEWTMYYRSEYLTALKTAQDAIKAFADLTDPVYSDFAKAREAVLAAAKLEKAAALPNANDAQTLKDAITTVKNIGEDNYNKNRGIYASYTADLFTRVSKAEALLHKQVGLNGFENNVRYYDANMAIKDLKDHTALLQSTIRFEGYECTGNGEITVTVSIAKLEGKTNDDGNTYGFAFKVGDYWADATNVSTTAITGTPNAQFKVDDTHVIEIDNATYEWETDGDYPDRLVCKVKVTPVSKDGSKDKFTSTDKILIQFYAKNVVDDDGQPTWSAAKITQNLTFTTGTWFGPTVKKAWVSDYGTSAATNDFEYQDDLGDLNDGAGNINGKAVSTYVGDDVKVTLQMSKDLGTYLDDTTGLSRSDAVRFAYAVLDAKGKGVMVNSYGNGTNPSVNVADKQATITGKTSPVVDDTYLVAGSMTAALTETVTNAKGDKGEITRSSASFTINPLSKWSAVKEIKKALADAKELNPSDYNALVGFDEDLGYIPGREDLTSVSAAFQVINDDIKEIETAITSSTVANSKTNRTAVLDLLKDLGEVYNRLAVKPIDVDAITALIAEVKTIKEDDYTYDSYGKMIDALADAEAAIDGSEEVLQSKVDAAYAALKAAKDGLVKEGAVDKTALTAAIASAKALVEADYTADSWAANKPLIDAAVTAAQAVVDNANATQAQVNTALNTLTAAVAKLEKTGGEDDGPQAPTTNNGTGWVLFENEWYFFKAGKLVANYWVGKIDGASQWDSNWYYVGADGKMLTGMQYVDDLHGGMGWYFLQPTNTKGEIGKMLTGWQWVGGQYGECYFSKANGSSGKCTWSELLGNWNGTTWVK